MAMEYSPASIPAGAAGKYLTFLVDDEAYGVPMPAVREIVRLRKAASVSQMSGQGARVVEMRRRALPVVDLSRGTKAPAGRNARSCLVVADGHLADGKSFHVAVLADSIEEVVNLWSDQTGNAARHPAGLVPTGLIGVAGVKGRVVQLLDLAGLLALASGAGDPSFPLRASAQAMAEPCSRVLPAG